MYAVSKTQTHKRRKRVSQAEEQIKVGEQALTELHKQLNGADVRVREQHRTFESTRTELSLTHKGLLEAHDELGEYRRKFKIMNHQITTLREEIAAKVRFEWQLRECVLWQAFP